MHIIRHTHQQIIRHHTPILKPYAPHFQPFPAASCVVFFFASGIRSDNHSPRVKQG